jgi:hypothetical protein
LWLVQGENDSKSIAEIARSADELVDLAGQRVSIGKTSSQVMRQDLRFITHVIPANASEHVPLL